MSSGLYLYGFVDAAPASPALGLWGEPIRGLTLGPDLVAAVGEAAEAPPLQPWALRGHDQALRRLASGCDALLPGRFGAFFAAEGELSEALRGQQASLSRALEEVRGSEQMTLRVYGEPRAAPAKPLPPGTGAAYLMAKLRSRLASLPELRRLRQALDGLVSRERLDSASTPPLLGTIFHLLPRGRSADYLARIEALSRETPDLRWSPSGPWAAYAFAPRLEAGDDA